MLGAAIAAGASLISGLFGQSSAKKQARKEEAAIRAANAAATRVADEMNAQVRARADEAALVPVATERESRSFVDMEGFMSAAEEHGFNPLTFLRSGALPLFAHTEDWTCTTGERAMDAALSGQYMPQLAPVIASTRVPSVGEVFGNAIQAGANELIGGLNQQQQNAFQMQQLQMQLAGANRVGAYTGSRSFNAPNAKLTGSVTKVPVIPDLWEAWRDNSVLGAGRTVWLPNAKIADNDQWAAAVMGQTAARLTGKNPLTGGPLLSIGSGTPYTDAAKSWLQKGYDYVLPPTKVKTSKGVSGGW